MEFFARVIGQPPELVQRFKTMWSALTCGLPIDPKLFGKFGKETKEYFVVTVPWCQLTPTVHKPMDHGEIILLLLPATLTVAMMNEEPGEATNKYSKVHFFTVFLQT